MNKVIKEIQELISKYGIENVESAILILEEDKVLNIAPFLIEDDDEEDEEDEEDETAEE